MNIEFCINRVELFNALRYFEPFVNPQENDSSKVIFEFHGDFVKLYVLFDELTIERTCPVVVGCGNLSFSLPIIDILNDIEKCQYEILKFVEEQFFGFLVYDAMKGGHLFDIKAFSTKFQKRPLQINTDNPVYNAINLEKDILIDSLRIMEKYTLSKGNQEYTRFIWFIINEGCCTVYSTTGSTLRLKKYPTQATGTHLFSIPGCYANKILSAIEKWPDSEYQSFEYDFFKCRLKNNNDGIVFVRNRDYPQGIDKVLDSRNVNGSATILINNLRSTFNMIKTMECKAQTIIMHFIYDHVNIYCKDKFENKSVYEFKDVDDCCHDFVLCLNIKLFELLLDEIDTDYVSLFLVDDRLVYIVSEDEYPFGDSRRILCVSNMDDNDKQLLAEGDASLQNHPQYIEKYINNDDDEEDEDIEYANPEEMKAEALSRMKSISLYEGSIACFEEDGEPQVYEPPFGASYALEDEELEDIHYMEQQKDILIWGVIRSFMKIGLEDYTVDHYLFVSNNKADWAAERQDLLDGTPFVYTTTHGDNPLQDYGHIDIYMSPGGTPLRR